MAVLLNEVVINSDGSFNFIPEWEENPITNMPGCDPEFIGSYHFFTVGSVTVTTTTFDTSTGQVVGTVDLNTLGEESFLFGYGFEDCSSIPSYPTINVPFTYVAAKCFYSKNPINVTVETFSPYNTTEIQVYAESFNGEGNYYILGTFRFISDATKFVNQDISSILDAYCLKILKTSIPNNDNAIEILSPHSIRFFTRSRYYDSGSWSSWVESQLSYVLFGGRGYEEVTSGNLELTSQFLLTNGNNFQSLAIDSAVYLLIEKAGTYNYTIDFVLFDGTMNGNVADTITTINGWAVVKLPINPVADTYKSTITIDIDGTILTTDFISDLYPHEQIEEFVFLSLRNGWRTLTCTSNLTSILEVSQNTYEKQQQFEYYEADNIATTEVWRAVGMKRFKVATGFMPEQMIDQLLQDFALSPKKFKWDSDLEKFIPVVVSTKSVEYLNSTRQGLRSFSFEYRPAFENNMPSRL
jgi:hypothetical protein